MLKTINITGHETKEFSFGIKHIVMDDRTKYEFFETKKDKTETKAFHQWKKFGLGVGKQVQAEVVEEEKSFTGKEGNPVKFTQRTIIYFKGDEYGTPYQTDLPEGSNTTIQAIVNQLKSHEMRISKLEGQTIGIDDEPVEPGVEINAEDLPF